MISATRLRWRARLSEAPRVLIAALSGRALAQAARLSGYAPLVADFFNDADTRALAQASCQVKGDFSQGFQETPLIAALHQLAPPGLRLDPPGLVCGTGFEDRPGLLAELGRHWRLLGNAPQAVARVKDPLALAALCAQAGVPHPETRLDPPAELAGWLVKQTGGSGGGHILAAQAATASCGHYYQRVVKGSAVSLLILADGRNCAVLGASLQWTAPVPGQPFRYGGAVRPALLVPGQFDALAAAAGRLAAILGLKGLNSCDFLVTDTGFTLLEINPRPGATLDIFTHPGLFQAHVDACNGRLPCQPLRFPQAEAAAIVYSERDIPALPARSWPGFVRDQPNPDTHLPNGAPICTIVAHAAEPHAARRLLDQRIAMIRSEIAHIPEA